MAFAFADAPPLLLLDMGRTGGICRNYLAATRALLDYRQRLCSFFSDAGLTLTRQHRGSRGRSVRRRSSRDHHRKVIEFQIEFFCFVSVCFLKQHSGFEYCVAEQDSGNFLEGFFLGLDPAAL
jgi:hypothetical protein